MEKWKVLRMVGVILVAVVFCLVMSFDADAIWHIVLGSGILFVVGIFGFILYNVAENELTYHGSFRYGNKVLPGKRIYS